MPLEQLAWDGRSKTRQDPLVYAAPDGSDWWMMTQQVQEAQQAASQAVELLAGQAVIAGQPICLQGDTMYPAQAIDSLLADAWGFTASDGAADTGVTCITRGQLTIEDWTPIAGNATLEPGSTYYLHPSVAGMITTTAPTLPGQFVVPLGKALSPLTLDVRIESPIQL